VERHSTHKSDKWFVHRATCTVVTILIATLTCLLTNGPTMGAFSSRPAGSQSVQLPTTASVFPVFQSTTDLAQGRFLVASRELGDPNFSETVILLLSYNQDGALGVVINRPTEVPLSSLLPEAKGLKGRKDFVYLGGPVARTNVLLLVQSQSQPKDSQHVIGDLYLIANQTTLKQIIDKTRAKTKVRAYVGYAGWSAGQLDMEVERGGWHIVPADSAIIFDKAAKDVWPALIGRGEAQWVRRLQPDSWLFLVLGTPSFNLGSLP